MTPVELAVEAAGWTGATLILLAYLLLSMARSPASRRSTSG